MLALMNAFTFIPRKKHENPPNKLIVTKFIRQKKKHQKQSCKPTKIFMTIFGKSIPAGSAKWKAFHQLVKHKNYKVSN